LFRYRIRVRGSSRVTRNGDGVGGVEKDGPEAAAVWLRTSFFATEQRGFSRFDVHRSKKIVDAFADARASCLATR